MVPQLRTRIALACFLFAALNMMAPQAVTPAAGANEAGSLTIDSQSGKSSKSKSPIHKSRNAERSSIGVRGNKTELALSRSQNSKLPLPESKQVLLKENYEPQIEVGPIDIHRKYRSMEGPYVIHKFTVADLISSGRVRLPEPMITYLDLPGGKAPAMLKTASESSGKPEGIVPAGDKPTELLWLRGIKIQVLDEHDKPLPTTEFMCHMNLDVDLVTRYMAFPQLEKSGYHRLITLTQGQSEFYFPEGFAVPVSSDEEWTFTFQAANRTTNEHRRIKHLCTLSFAKDSDLKKPMKALHWYNPYISVQLKSEADRLSHAGPGCLQFSDGTNAPNMVAGSDFKDSRGVMVSPHWAIPPGLHTYKIPLSQTEDKELGDEDRVIHAVWSHIHPACINAALVECNATPQGHKVFDVNAKTTFTPGAQLMHIDTILSHSGIPFKAGKNYELTATYDNPTNETLDSMVVFGVFCESKTFVRPDWLQGQESLKRTANTASNASGNSSPTKCDLFCGVKHDSK